jgi:hypothetical protein
MASVVLDSWLSFNCQVYFPTNQASTVAPKKRKHLASGIYDVTAQNSEVRESLPQRLLDSRSLNEKSTR